MVLLPGADARMLGGSTRMRNARVASRAGATVVDLPAVGADCDACAIVVPPHVLIETALFSSSMPTTPVWLENPSAGASVLAGPAADVARLVMVQSHGSGGPPKLHAKAAGLHDDRGPRVQGTDGGQEDVLPRQTVSPAALLDISTPAARRHATWAILKRTAKPTDGWVARHCNRPISRLFSFVLLSMGLKASHASAITLLVGLAAAALALRPGYTALVGTGILFQLASVLDGVDGEMARATLTESEAGARLDAIIDQLTYVACFIGVTIGWAREGGGAQALFWMVTIALALVLSLVRGGRFVSRYAPDASFVFIYRAIHRAAKEFDLFALRMAAESFSLLRRDLFAVLFLVVSLFGQRALVPALVGFGIILANVTFSVYRRELEAGAVLERG